MLTGDADDAVATDLTALRALAALPLPEPDAVEAAAASPEAAIGEAARVEATDAGRARAHADLLDSALTAHTAQGHDDCPVCGRGARG